MPDKYSDVYGKKLFFITFFFIISLFLNPSFCIADDSANNSAQDKKIVLLQIPSTLEGDYKPMSESEIYSIQETNLEKNLPNTDVVILDLNDPRIKGMDLTGDILMSDIRKLAEMFNASFVSWGKIKFTRESKTVYAAPGSFTTYYLLTVTCVTNVKVYDVNTNEIAIDQPMIQSNGQRTQAVIDSKEYTNIEKDLTRQCLSDLSSNLIASIKKRLNPQQPKN